MTINIISNILLLLSLGLEFYCILTFIFIEMLNIMCVACLEIERILYANKEREYENELPNILMNFLRNGEKSEMEERVKNENFIFIFFLRSNSFSFILCAIVRTFMHIAIKYTQSSMKVNRISI